MPDWLHILAIVSLCIGGFCSLVAGFLTSYPVNVWLVRSGVKERM